MPDGLGGADSLFRTSRPRTEQIFRSPFPLRDVGMGDCPGVGYISGKPHLPPSCLSRFLVIFWIGAGRLRLGWRYLRTEVEGLRLDEHVHRSLSFFPPLY